MTVIVIDVAGAMPINPTLVKTNLVNAVLLTIFTTVPDLTVIADGLNAARPCAFVIIRETVAVLLLAERVMAWALPDPKAKKENSASARNALNKQIRIPGWIRFVVTSIPPYC